MLPLLTPSKPAIMRRVVVLPQPEGPSNVTRVPASTVSEILSTATVSFPYSFVTSRKVTVAAALFLGLSDI